MLQGQFILQRQFIVSDSLAALPCDTHTHTHTHTCPMASLVISDAYEGMSVSSDLTFVIRGSWQQLAAGLSAQHASASQLVSIRVSLTEDPKRH